MGLNAYLLFIFLVLLTAINMALLGIFNPAKPGPKRLPLPQDTEQAIKLARIGVYISSFIPFTKKFLSRMRLDEKLKKNLEAAHLAISPEAYFNMKLLIMLALVILTFVGFGKLGPIVFLLPVILGYLLPDLWLNRKVAVRKNQVIRYLPETVDLLGLCVEAGLDFTSALKWISEKVPVNPTIEELTIVAKEIKLGKTKVQALKDMSARLRIPELNSFVQTLVQAERMGTPVAESFRNISEDTRSMRFQRSERLALQAPLKILIPLVFCILPVIVLIVAGPLFLEFMQGNTFKGF